QIDAVAMSVYNIEERGVGMIIGDQTGIGKGRIAASIIRYGAEQGLRPIFITEKANLFSDIYRDLAAIGSEHLVPFIVNSRESKTDIKDEDGNVIYQALPVEDQNRIFSGQRIPGNFNFVVATYSQFNSPDKKPAKPAFLNAIAEDNIVILDEAHNSSGSGNTGNFMQSALSNTRGVVFLSATFAKRPDNMPIYAMKTSIRDASMSRDALIEAVTKGGVALQEILASQLVAEGQMIRRERSFEGVEVNYITLEEKEQEHKAIADNITSIIRDIIRFQTTYVDKIVDELDDIAVAEGKQVTIREGTSQAGVDNLPYFSKVFNVINQMLFSIKAEAVAERAIARLKEGKNPVIAFASTMGSFIEQTENNMGLPVSDGDTINADFSVVLRKGLDGIMRYTETDVDGKKVFKQFELSEFPPDAQAEYHRISDRIKDAATGITISPIDVIVRRLTDAGYKVAEVTGRKYELQINAKSGMALVVTRKRVNTNDAFRQFNNNEVDVLLINQSGSTGASAHAIVTPKIPKEEVRQRVMIVLQAELDINTEVQKRGRINRTGQIYKPVYDYLNSAIPAEKRLMMMLQKKLKSLDANTTSNQKSSTKILDVPDFLNKYGDRIVAEYLKENPEVNALLDDPLAIADREIDAVGLEDAAHKVSGRVAVLSTAMQQDFYNEISSRYNEYVEYLKQIGEYDLEVEAMDLQAETQSTRTVIVGKGGTSEFGDDSILETVMANVLKKPFTKQELNNLLSESLQGKDGQELQKEIKQEYENFVEEQLKREIGDSTAHYEELVQNIPQEKKIARIIETATAADAQQAIKARTSELHKAMAETEERIRKTFANRKQYLESIFESFYVGRNLNYPASTLDGGQELVPAVFLGFIIDKKNLPAGLPAITHGKAGKNPYAPSSIRLRFAIASSSKYIAIPASYAKDIRAIIGASVGLPQLDKETLLTKWEASIKESTVDRKIRHIITGNVLQAFSTYKGKLVSYTTFDGRIKKGILMPEYWEPGNEVQQKTVVPILRALKIIRSLTVGASLTTKNDVSFFRQPEKFKIVVSASRSWGGDVYLDPDILNVVDRNTFEKISDKMMATLGVDKIDRLVEILQEKFNDSVSLSASQFELIKTEIPKKQLQAKPKLFVLPNNPPAQTRINDLELEAMALELELELLNFAA
ncbi:MAG: strawberry notch-like NTP hydrolase domain-containing protein, partial [Bacteroidota bacterium]